MALAKLRQYAVLKSLRQVLWYIVTMDMLIGWWAAMIAKAVMEEEFRHLKTAVLPQTMVLGHIKLCKYKQPNRMIG
jgi:hypothetical protein